MEIDTTITKPNLLQEIMTRAIEQIIGPGLALADFTIDEVSKLGIPPDALDGVLLIVGWMESEGAVVRIVRPYDGQSIWALAPGRTPQDLVNMAGAVLAGCTPQDLANIAEDCRTRARQEH